MIRNTTVIVAAAVFAFGILLPAPALSAPDAWLRIRVVESGEDGEKVSVNLPLSLIEQILPHVRDGAGFREGKVRLGATDMNGTDIRAIMQAISNAKDGEYVTVEGQNENVRVAKAGDQLIVDVKDREEKVKVRIPFAVLDAMIADTAADELDILAAIRALAESGDGDLVTVDDGKSTIRIWVDRQPG